MTSRLGLHSIHFTIRFVESRHLGGGHGFGVVTQSEQTQGGQFCPPAFSGKSLKAHIPIKRRLSCGGELKCVWHFSVY